jgi:transmembrane sensor
MTLSDTLNHQDIDHQASTWFALIVSRKESPEERAAFESWLAESPAHTEAYLKYEDIWANLARIPTTNVVEFKNDSVKKNQQNSLAQNHTSVLAGVFGGRSKPTWRYVQSLAATFCITAIGYLFYVGANTDDVITYSARTAEIREIVLVDGSRVTLGPLSEISVQMREDRRTINVIRGQVFFDIASLRRNNKKVPFEVSSKNFFIEVIGTMFDVQVNNDKTTITVAEGIVEVTYKAQKLQLISGQKIATIGADSSTLSDIHEIDPANIASWRSGRLIYLNKTLLDVITDVNRYYAGDLRLIDESISDLRLTTSFTIDDIPYLTKQLEALLPVKVDVRSNRDIVISGLD